MAVLVVFGQDRPLWGFVNYDDDHYLYVNDKIKGGISGENVEWGCLSTFHFSNWHPLTWLSYLLDYEIYGLTPGGYHATNVILHAATSVLLFPPAATAHDRAQDLGRSCLG